MVQESWYSSSWFLVLAVAAWFWTGFVHKVLIFHFKCTLKCPLQFVPIWTSLKFCRLLKGSIYAKTHWLWYSWVQHLHVCLRIYYNGKLTFAFTWNMITICGHTWCGLTYYRVLLAKDCGFKEWKLSLSTWLSGKSSANHVHFTGVSSYYLLRKNDKYIASWFP